MTEIVVVLKFVVGKRTLFLCVSIQMSEGRASVKDFLFHSVYESLEEERRNYIFPEKRAVTTEIHC